MSTTPKRNVSRSITRIKEVWRELDYAQRRSLELRTGLSFDKPVRDARSIQELESLYDLPAYDPIPARSAMAQSNAQ
ncbi:MAG TPA: hypothetical protein VFB39_10990 [Solirubrobacteraceae bacterium]|nr:hypothetical protein [Solirubrobacteraceae bacterium]